MFRFEDFMFSFTLKPLINFNFGDRQAEFCVSISFMYLRAGSQVFLWAEPTAPKGGNGCSDRRHRELIKSNVSRGQMMPDYLLDSKQCTQLSINQSIMTP